MAERLSLPAFFHIIIRFMEPQAAACVKETVR